MSYVIHTPPCNPVLSPRGSPLHIDIWGVFFKACQYQTVLGEQVCKKEIGSCPRVIWGTGIQNAKPPLKMWVIKIN